MGRSVNHRVMLIGKTGSGVSASGNTIVGEDVFPSGRSLTSITNRCQTHTAEVSNGRVTVMDCPNFCNSNDVHLSLEISRGLKTCSSGIHAILLVLSLHRFTQQDLDTVASFKQMFGKNIVKHTMLLFTHGDEIHNELLDQLIRRNAALSKQIRGFGGRFHLLNNKDQKNRDQVTELLEKIEHMVQGNKNSCYTPQTFRTQSIKVFLMRITTRKYMCALMSIVTLALGWIRLMNEDFVDIGTFLHGCAGGVMAAGSGATLGAVSKKIYSKQTTGRFSKEHGIYANVLAVMCGCVVGWTTVHFVGPAHLSARVLGGTLGGAGVQLIWSSHTKM